MILLTVLILLLIGLVIMTTLGISIFGAGAIFIFSDVIVCCVVIFLIIRKIIQNRN